MLHLIRRSAVRWWDVFRRGPDVRRLGRHVQALEAHAKESRVRWKEACADLKRLTALRHRRVLDPDIVRGLLPLRFSTIPGRAARMNAATADLQLEHLSDSYREALIAAHHPVDGLVRTNLEGLAWWVPIHASVTGAARDRLLAKQRFPYRNITQTREFSLGPVMIDIGANIGRMSIPRVILGDVAQAYCAEPDPLNYMALVRNVADNDLRGLVLPDRAAIGAVTGSAHLRHAKYSGGHRLVAEADARDTIDVPCWRLDDWCRRLSIDPQLVTYVKVDTQGWEVDVLRGAPELLKFRHIAWQLEISPSMLSAAGTSSGELFGMCAEHFSHFVDLSKEATGPRARLTRDLEGALDYVKADDSQTDIVLFNTASIAD